jgi:hypothetical protein
MHVTRTAGGGWMNRSIPFSHRRLEIVDPGGGFWLAADGSYRVVRLNENGDTSLVLEVEVPEEPVTNADRQRFTEESLERSPDQRRAVEELIELSPSTKPVINQLHVDDEGRLWVRRRTNDDADSHYDIFAREGQYLGSIRLLFSPVVHFPTRVRDGQLYTLTADSLGVHTVVRAALPSLRAVH